MALIKLNNQSLTNLTALPAIDGSALTGISTGSIGVGQTWTDVTSSRTTGTTYTNSTGLPIFVSVFIADAPNQASTLVFTVDGSTVFPTMNGPIGYRGQFSLIVPNGSTYAISWNANANFGGWWELR